MTMPSSGSASSVIALLRTTVATHLLGHLIPPPSTLPLPTMLTVSWTVSLLAAQAALTFWSPPICTVQDSPVALPLQAPPQPVKTSPGDR
jgi:hypothetical protein